MERPGRPTVTRCWRIMTWKTARRISATCRCAPARSTNSSPAEAKRLPAGVGRADPAGAKRRPGVAEQGGAADLRRRLPQLLQPGLSAAEGLQLAGGAGAGWRLAGCAGRQAGRFRRPDDAARSLPHRSRCGKCRTPGWWRSARTPTRRITAASPTRRAIPNRRSPIGCMTPNGAATKARRNIANASRSDVALITQRITAATGKAPRVGLAVRRGRRRGAGHRAQARLPHGADAGERAGRRQRACKRAAHAGGRQPVADELRPAADADTEPADRAGGARRSDYLYDPDPQQQAKISTS